MGRGEAGLWGDQVKHGEYPLHLGGGGSWGGGHLEKKEHGVFHTHWAEHPIQQGQEQRVGTPYTAAGAPHIVRVESCGGVGGSSPIPPAPVK